MSRRSQNISVTVPEQELETAVIHYKALLGVSEESRTEGGIELKGDNFILWIDVAKLKPQVLQEFVVESAEAARDAVKNSKATIVGKSDCGVYVTDPYGLDFHFYVEPAN